MRAFRDPVRLIPLLFAGLILIGTALLWNPLATASGDQPPLVTALFTATSAVAVTGLIVVDTGSYWSAFGQGVILLLIQIGGLGVMAAASLLGLMAGRGFGLSQRMATRVERDRLHLGDTASVLRQILRVTLVVEVSMAVILVARFASYYDMPFAEALWHGTFHSISAFNNAGFSTFYDSVMGFQSDGWVLGPIMLAIIIAAIGFPVMQDLRAKGFTFRRLTVHSKVTLTGTAALLLIGFLATLVMEWSNPETLGAMATGPKLLNAMFHSVMPRTAGFNSINMGAVNGETLVLNYVLMFIGGGSAGTAGGIKITTFAVLLAIVWAEVRRRRDAGLFGRRFGHAIERQALTITVLAAMLIMLATMYILSVTELALRDVLFETISAFATVGMSTGITASLPNSALIVLALLMFIGRVGTITVATALALNGPSHIPYRYPEEPPLVG